MVSYVALTSVSLTRFRRREERAGRRRGKPLLGQEQTQKADLAFIDQIGKALGLRTVAASTRVSAPAGVRALSVAGRCIWRHRMTIRPWWSVRRGEGGGRSAALRAGTSW